MKKTLINHYFNCLFFVLLFPYNKFKEFSHSKRREIEQELNWEGGVLCIFEYNEINI